MAGLLAVVAHLLGGTSLGAGALLRGERGMNRRGAKDGMRGKTGSEVTGCDAHTNDPQISLAHRSDCIALSVRLRRQTMSDGGA